GTKNPNYSDVLYVEELIADRTVNTMPPATYDAYRDHGQPAARLLDGLAEAPQLLEQVAALGVDLAAITAQLEREGVDAFVVSYQNLVQALADKTAALEQHATR
ncbi:MAG TPA: transaldolase family protein, partial [Gammaproteobacteria bacterium]|nr:transaldolase family protein [Gammaproteobacteria bacterium]